MDRPNFQSLSQQFAENDGEGCSRLESISTRASDCRKARRVDAYF